MQPLDTTEHYTVTLASSKDNSQGGDRISLYHTGYHTESIIINKIQKLSIMYIDGF